MSNLRTASAAQAYEEIKRRVIECVYPPGTKLSEARLADEMGCGRSPIRTAFSRLQAEGWIAVNPQSGTYVRTPTEREIRDMFETRLLLETHVTRAAARNIDDEELRRLRSAFRRLSRSRGTSAGSDEAFNQIDSLFHAAIYHAAANELMAGILATLLDKAHWLKNAFPSPPKRVALAFAEIERVLESLEARDPDEAARRMREHIGNAGDFAVGKRRRAVRGARKD